MIKIQIVDWKKSSTKIVIVVFSALLILSSYFIISSYQSYLQNAQVNTLKNLQAISNTLSLQIESNKIVYLDSLFLSGQSKEDISNDSILISIHTILSQAAIINKVEEPISIIYYDAKRTKFFFISNSSDTTYFSDPYLKVPSEFFLAYENGGTVGPYVDEFGTWLSSLTPIKNESNITIGVVEVDMKFDSFIKTANTTLYKNLLASILIFILTSIVLLRYVRIVLVTEEIIKTKLTRSHKIIEEKNNDIIQSINYALRIQTAILPSFELIKEHLPDTFILYKPKDIVAGDFYWFETVNDVVLFAACDCTGHGVPGAMVSVVCNNALNRAVREFGLTQPAAILDKTAEIVIENFSQSEEDIKDGMDISLCAYNSKTKTIQWAGANNPLWLMQNGKLLETKADKQPVGKDENNKPFTNHTFSLNTGDIIYLFTDGFADQFGGETGEKKLTRKRFKDLILTIQNKSLKEQGISLDKFIIEYRKEIEQIDDILVMGVKV